MNQQQALILKCHGKRVIVLEASGQRHEVIISYRNRYQKLNEGVILSYREKSRYKNIFYIQEPLLDYFPLEFAKNNIQLMHCLLELCYYFIPVGSCTSGVFDFFKAVYKMSEKGLLPHALIIVAKLLVILGIYPIEKEFQHLIQVLSETPIDNVSQSVLELAQEDLFNRWVQWCVADHPFGHWFKAVPFFLKNEKTIK